MVVTEVRGRYEDFLENRLPAFVKSKPHWCTKGLTDLELGPLGQAAGHEAVLETALYCPPPPGAALFKVRSDLVSSLVAMGQGALQAVAENWAKIMSQPCYTHSASGRRLHPDWEASYALGVIQAITAIAKNRGDENDLYLLIEW
jgi:hypothetical protein